MSILCSFPGSVDTFEVLCFLIQVMELLENLKNLQELWLGRNRIRTVNLCGLKCIKKISLQSNRLTSMIGFQVLIPNSCALSL